MTYSSLAVSSAITSLLNPPTFLGVQRHLLITLQSMLTVNNTPKLPRKTKPKGRHPDKVLSASFARTAVPGSTATPGHDVAVASVAGSGSCTGPTARPAATEGAASVTTPGGVYRRWSARRRFRSSTSVAAPLPSHIPSRNASMSTNPRWNTSSGVARCPAPAKGRRHVPNNMGQCPISIQVFFPDAPRSCEGMESPCVQAEARVRMPVTRSPRPRSVPARRRWSAEARP